VQNVHKAVEYYIHHNTAHDTDEGAIEFALREFKVTWGQFLSELEKRPGFGNCRKY